MYKQDNKNYDINKWRRWSYRDRLKTLAVCSKEFTFESAPYIDSLMICQMLFEENAFVITKDEHRKDMPFICGRLSGVSEFDEYYRPTRWGMVTMNGKYNRTDLTNDNSVICYASPVRYGLDYNPTLKETVYLYADRLATIDSVIKVNIETQKTPYIVQPTPENGINLKHVISNLQNASELIINSGAKDLDEFIKVAELKSPWVADKLTEIKHETYNEFYTFLGLQNSNVEKRERLITAEAEANNGVIELYQYCAMKPLEIAVDKMNSLWPELGVTVKPTVRVEKLSVNADDGGDMNG